MKQFSATLSVIVIIGMSIMPISAGPVSFPDESISITLERGMCFGTCPVYGITLFGNGTTFWEGRYFVENEGNITDSIDPLIVADLFHHLDFDGFFLLNDSYSSYGITDMPSATLTVQNNSINKRVYHYYGDRSAPEILFMMEDAVDTVANTSRWIGNSSVTDN